MTDAISNGEKPRGRPFEPGNNANPNGRPKGSRNKLSEAFTAALHADFVEHGATAITKVRDEDPAAYLRVIASVVPKQLEIKEGAFDGVDDEQLAAIVAAARSALGVGDGRREGTGDPEGEEPPEGVSSVH
jgi:hypothetical protein